ncbi:hypothetical protein [Naasia aerilata]|uniref:Uncharacterized protein n=1 Tax=Naasia aerilata TaxID=1162966 RepID=A0ABN6XHM0_9MICO|nr:hypothetical protein [Naasia aerilata]BDZ44335.1 hypothetical protein GCM10025866_02440 [Naasia aerilata]
MKLSRSRGRRTAAGLVLAVAVGGSVLLTAGPAVATPSEVKISFDSPREVSIEYGEPWGLTLSSIATASCYGCDTTVTLLVDGDAAASTWGTAGTRSYGTSQSYFSSYQVDEPLSAGEHELTATVAGNQFGLELFGQTAEPATITVAPAALAVDLRVETDPIHSANAVVTARLAGHFIESLVPRQYDDQEDSHQPPMLPAGTWSVSIADASGAAVYTQETPVEAGGDPYLTQYWKDVPAGTTFTASASFTPSGDTADDFTVTNAENASYTSPAATTVVAPVDEPDAVEPTASTAGPSVPLWVAAAAGLVGLSGLLAILLTLLLVRRRPRPAAGPDSSSPADGPAAPDADTAVLQESAHV